MTETLARQSIQTWVQAALAAFLLNLVAYVGFMTSGGIWFTISDALGLTRKELRPQ